jgi:putative CocE/NonD family hydrolase
MASVKRGLFGSLLDRLYARAHGLSPETTSYTIKRLRIPVGDDLKISANLYRPIKAKPLATILVRTPYGIGLVPSVGLARIFAARGYQVLLSSCRGTADSDGEFNPGRHEVADGHAIVGWMRNQRWYTGSFATMGASYLGYAQWALLSNPPADMKTAVISTGPHDFGNFFWGSGAFSSDIIAWADMQVRMRRGDGTLSLLMSSSSQKAQLRTLYNAVPLLDAVDKYFKGSAPAWLRRTLTIPNQKDAYWGPLRQDGALKMANVPILLTTGWHDLVKESVMEQYSTLARRGCNVGLTVGPWTHLGAIGRRNMPEILAWLDEHLAHGKESRRRSPVRVFVTGAEEWRELPKWPPPTSSHQLFLCPGKKLSRAPPSEAASESTFTFNPADPTPSIAAPSLFDHGFSPKSPDDALAARPDVLSFTTEPLDQDIEVCGQPSIQLYHSSSHPNVDLFVLISQVDSKGTSHSITEKYVRLDASRHQDPLELALGNCAHRFRKGDRIRLLIAGGSHPRYIRNLGTGDNPGTASALQVTSHTISHNALSVSKLTLPVTTPGIPEK